jgi:hypothetical protein
MEDPVSRWSLGLVALLAIAACAPNSLPPQLTVSPHAETADLTLRLELPWRRLQFVDGSNRVHITIDGPDLTTPYERLLLLDPAGNALVTLPQVPVGPHRIVTVQAVDDNNVAIPGAVVGTAGELVKGANSLSLSAATSTLADIARQVLAMDRDKKTTLLSKVVWTTATNAIVGYVRDLKVPLPALLDTTAIAQAVYAGSGVFPAASASLVRQAGKVELRPTGMPPGVSIFASIGDLASRPVMLSNNVPVTIDGVVPGTWTLTLQPSGAGLAPQTQSVQVAAGATLKLPLDFTASTVAAPMTDPFGPGASAVLPVGGKDTIVAVGGTTYSDQNGLASVQGVSLVSASGVVTPVAGLGAPVLQPAATVFNGKLYWFGGRDASAPVGTGLIYDPASSASPSPTAPMPSSRTVRAASAGTIGNTIYVAGGIVSDDMTSNNDILAYDPAGDAWQPTPVMSLAVDRWDMASAVVGSTWYLFGGLRVENVFAGGAIGPAPVAKNTVSAFVPSPTPAWTALAPMPTARSGAAAVVVNGKIWVIGGAGLLGEPTAAVEVYDPATNAWAIKPPLKRARAHPAAGLLNGKITVAGGLDGQDPVSALPLTNVEVLTP